MHRSLLKTVSVLALSLFAFPVLAQPVSAANVDPYGYGSVPLPPPQPQILPMLMPSFQAQQATGGYAPLSRYAPQYATQSTAQSTAAMYAGQSSPHPVTTAAFGVVPDYLPENRMTTANYAKPATPQASSVGYVVQPQAGGIQAAAQQAAPQVAQYGAQAAPQAVSQYAPQYGAQVGQQVGQQVSQAAQPYAQQAYAPAYGATQQVANGATQQVANYAAPSIAPQVPSYAALQPTVQATAPTNYGAYNAPVQNSITTAANYDGGASYQAPAYQPSSGYQGPASQVNAPQTYTAPGYAVQGDASQQPQMQPQVQTYAYNNQPQTYTTTQIYTPSPALTVQQTADANSQNYATSPAPRASDANVSLATDPSSGPWYFALRSGLTLAQDTDFSFAGSTVTTEYQTGWQLGTAAGYEFKAFNSWLAPRAEIELTYDQQLANAHTVKGTKTSDPDAYGFQRNLDLMANGYLDFRLNRYLAPYIGGGVGVGYADFDRYGTSAGGVIMDDNDVGFVWQAMGGLGINLSNSAMIDLGYRYQQNTGVNLKARDGTTSTTSTAEGKHVLLVGFRNNF